MTISIYLIASVAPIFYASNDNTYEWPDISFVVLDENPNMFLFERNINIVSTIREVLLIPIVNNYKCDNIRYPIAIADPLLVELGKATLKELLSKDAKNYQSVRSCIVIARGYCPGTLQPTINYAGNYKGETVWMIELAKINNAQYKKAYESIIEELNNKQLTIGKRMIFEKALKEKRIISSSELLSPVIRFDDGYRRAASFWDVKPGTEISICISEKGMNLIKEHLQPAE